MSEVTEFLESAVKSINAPRFVKLTLSKPTRQAGDLLNVYVKLAEIRHAITLSFTYHFKNNDKVKNFSVPEGMEELSSLLKTSFYHATLFSIDEDLNLRISKKGNAGLIKTEATFTELRDPAHDRQKVKRTQHTDSYLIALGINDAQGVLIPKMADKFRQINKYLEIMENQIQSTELPEKMTIVDMGSGKGYLTFALYDFLKNKKNRDVSVTGIEVRKELVDYCNTVAKQCGFDQLHFVQQSIEEFNDKKVDIVIALHACDTATDDAIYKALIANASLIVCAPCCHKQIRQQVKGKEQESPLLKYGIFKERQFEMVTDTIRALILEKKNYATSIFEFVSNEHTRKNVLLVGTKTDKKADQRGLDEKINAIKKSYQIDYHYLEKLIVN